MLSEQKAYWGNGNLHYQHWVDESGQLQGECRFWHEDGSPLAHCFYLNDAVHGEHIGWREDGRIFRHTYGINGKEVHNFLKKPLTEDEKVLLYLKYGAPMIGVDNVD